MPIADDCPSAIAPNDFVTARDARSPADQLPTLQRNALRKIFDRQQFTPEEVAGLGYRRLQQAEGIGSKGLLAIRDWLAVHGYTLDRPAPSVGACSGGGRDLRRSIELAVRLLKAHGYRVEPRRAKKTGGAG